MTDPAILVVAKAAQLRELHPTLTPDQARYVAHCIVQHQVPIITSIDVANVHTMADWHAMVHSRTRHTGRGSHTHTTTDWPT